jgi:hydrogenase/urease accessory protein HupE
MRWWLAVVIMLLSARPAAADELRPGYLAFSQKTQSNWTLVWKVPERSGLAFTTMPILPKGCVYDGGQSRDIGPAALTLIGKVRCSGPVAGGRIGLATLSGSLTDILVRVAPLGRAVQVLRLTAEAPTGVISAKPGQWQVARTYFVTGVEHILSGYDHLLFVVSLVLLLGAIWTVAEAVTAFTIAHSITLVGTTLGLFGLPQRPVESVIALSIMFLAVEVVKKDPTHPRLSERIPWVVAFLFGLLHGFGFAGALREIGLPEDDVPTALLTFNLGVEAGQLLIVAATLTFIATLARIAEPLMKPAIRLASYAIGSVASYWFIVRTLL